MSSQALSIPSLHSIDLKRIRAAAEDPESRPMAEKLLRTIQESLVLTDRNLRATEEAIKRLEQQRDQWLAMHDGCLQREQAVQAILDETQRGRRV